MDSDSIATGVLLAFVGMWWGGILWAIISQDMRIVFLIGLLVTGAFLYSMGFNSGSMAVAAAVGIGFLFAKATHDGV